MSIFALSTYDTDYILVKEDLVFDAVYCWILNGHVVNGMPESRTPKDGSVTTFERDPKIQKMVDLARGAESAEEKFDLILVSRWVPSEAVQSAYCNNFLPAVQKCFNESDWVPQSRDAILNVYLYPAIH